MGTDAGELGFAGPGEQEQPARQEGQPLGSWEQGSEEREREPAIDVEELGFSEPGEQEPEQQEGQPSGSWWQPTAQRAEPRPG